MDLIIDINTDIYPLLGTDRFSLVLASTLYKDNRPDPGVYTNYSNEVMIHNSIFTSQKTLMDDYEYCMYGKVFQYQYKDDGKMYFLRFWCYSQSHLCFLWWSFDEFRGRYEVYSEY